ncbi:MAG: ParB N-terminal domain-containing protein [Thermomicrobiales bacterium]
MTSYTTTLTLTAIVADEGYQPRRALNENHVRQLMASDPDAWPPLLVSPNDDGFFFLIDGFHRREAAIRLGLETLVCTVEPGAGYPEAFAANMAHGLTLTIDERKDFARWLADQESGLSYRELGRRSGLNHETVKRALTEGAEPTAPRPRTTPDPIAKLVRTVVTTYDAGHGRTWLGLGRDGNPSAFRAEIAAYDEDDQPEVAQALLAFGHACVAAAQPFLLGEG